jgi:LCP family protein required for cell wall assembly
MVGQVEELQTDRPPRSRRRRGRGLFLAIAGVLSILVTVASGLAIAGVAYLNGKLVHIPSGRGADASTGGLPNVDSICVNHACNFLVLGSDSRAGLSKRQQSGFGNAQTVQGQRSDTIMVVHADPANDRTVILQIPRDLRVAIPGHGVDKINSAFDYGPNVTVQTVEKLTGFRINHYVEVNFTGFERLVDALGGVPICIDKPMSDQLAGLHLPHAGCYNLQGPQALAFVRARHVAGDTIPDFSRISRQQQFMRAVINKVLSLGAFTKIFALAHAIQDNVKVDDKLNIDDLQELTNRMAQVGQRGVIFRVVPAVPVTLGGVDYVEAIQPQTDRLFNRILAGKRLGSLGLEEPLTPVSPADITVQVWDANSGGQAASVVTYLQKAGFIVLPMQAAPATYAKTQLLWAKGADQQKTVVASYLGTVPVLSDQGVRGTADVTVVIGPDFKGIGGSRT